MSSAVSDPAVDVAAAWAAPLGVPASDLRAMIVGVDVGTSVRVVVRYVGRHRRLVRHSAPAPRGAVPSVGPSGATAADPWASELEGLGPAVRSTELCPDCAGAGERRCSSCGGTGARTCGCEGGVRSCRTCAGSGAMEHWTEVAESAFERVVTAGQPDAQVGEPSERWTGAPVEASGEVASWQHRLQPATREGERIDRVSVDIWRGTRTSYRVSVAGVVGRLTVGPSGVARDARAPFQARAGIVALGAWATATWASAVFVVFVSRHAWFASGWQAGMLGAIVFMLPALGAVVAAEACVARRRWGRRFALGALLSTVFACQGLLTWSASPSMAAAEVAFAAGREVEAAAEAAACLALDLESQRAQRLLDELRLRRVLGARTVASAAALATAGFHDDAVAARAVGAVRDRVAREVAADQAAGIWSSTPTLVGLLPEAERAAPALLSLLAAYALKRYDDCLATLDPDCAGRALVDAKAAKASDATLAERRMAAAAAVAARTQRPWAVVRSQAPLAERERACAELRAPMAFGEATAAPALRPTPTEVRSACEKVAVAAAAQRARQEEEASARARREAQRREAEAARAAWASAPVRCRDGTLSPTCTCSNAHTGCCSGHGGVAGCSR